MGMVEGRIGAHTHEFPDANLDGGVARIILKMRNLVVGHASLRRGEFGFGGPYTLGRQKCSG